LSKKEVEPEEREVGERREEDGGRMEEGRKRERRGRVGGKEERRMRQTSDRQRIPNLCAIQSGKDTCKKLNPENFTRFSSQAAS
jgi:hypothetical protein